MARRQVLVQLDDALVDQLDAVAVRRGTNRSELLRLGAAAILQADAETTADQAHAASYAEQPQDPVLVEALGRAAAITMAPW